MPTNGPLIYMITFPSGRRYIGQTSRTFEERMKSHKNSIRALRGCRLVKAAVKKYGWNSVKTEILVLCDEKDLDDYETKFIELYNTLAPNGYNLETGGHGNKIISETSRKLMSEAQKRRDNRPFRKSDETRNLPKYIGKVNRQYSKGYKISRHPSCLYKNFCDKNKTDSENLQDAIKFLSELDTGEVKVEPRPKKTLPVGIHTAGNGFRVELRDPVYGRYTKLFNTGPYTTEEQYERALNHMASVKLSRLMDETKQSELLEIKTQTDKIVASLESLMESNKNQLRLIDELERKIDMLRKMFND